MRIYAYPPFDTLLGKAEIELNQENLSLWELLQILAQNYPAFKHELPDKATDEGLRARMLPIGEGHIYSVTDTIPADAILKIFPPLTGG
ncbi:MAG TPA: MoaD/ThiS family protein [Firmicutes bacterium]|nr:MoaD/ThiS family protein [Bacillota bacterium]